jgi:hypothetical protein
LGAKYVALDGRQAAKDEIMKFRRLTLLVIILLCLFVGFLYGRLALRVAMAHDQIEIFEEMRLKASTNSPQEAAECLQYVQNYYPSGTKQPSGSRLDRIVETARSNAVREITVRIQTNRLPPPN